jgi:hypothetical protein
MQIRRVPALCLAILLAAVSWPVHAQRNNNNNPPKPTPEQFDLELLYRGVDAVVAGQPGPVDIPVTMVQHHLLMTQTGAVMVPYTLKIDRSKVTGPLLAYVRVVDKDAPQGTMPAPAAAPAETRGNNDRNRKNRNQPPPAPVPVGPTFPVSLSVTLNVPADGIVQRAIELKPGRYEMFVAIKEKSTTVPALDPKVPLPMLTGGLMRTDLTIPDLSTGLGTSSVILANAVEPVTAPLTPEQQMASPYTIGGVLKITPNITGQFAKASELVAVFWLYGVTSVSGKPDVTVDYTFHRKAGETDKYFNRTDPQAYNAQSSAPTFNLDAGHQVMAIQGLSVQSFPAGDYRMEIKITDKPSGKSITQNVNFTVLPV